MSDEEARELYRRVWGMARRVSVARWIDREDMVQGVVERCLRRGDAGLDGKRLWGAMMDWLRIEAGTRRQRRTGEWVVPSGLMEDVADWRDVRRRAARDGIEDGLALAGRKQDARFLVLLACGYSGQEIGEMEGCSDNLVYVRSHLARARIRKGVRDAVSRRV